MHMAAEDSRNEYAVDRIPVRGRFREQRLN